MTMNLKPMLRYQLRDYWISGLIFFLANLGAVLLVFISLSVFEGPNHASYSGYSFAGGIFMLVMGVVLPRQSMRLGGQLSISRKTSFAALLISSAVASLGLALAGDILMVVSQKAAWSVNGLVFTDIYALLYAASAESLTLTEHVSSILFGTCFMVVNFALGLFFTFLFWRLGKLGQLVAGFCIPAALIGVPALLGVFKVPLAPVTRQIEKLVIACLDSVWLTMGVFLLAAMVFVLISWFLVRQTNIRGTSLK